MDLDRMFRRFFNVPKSATLSLAWRRRRFADLQGASTRLDYVYVQIDYRVHISVALEGLMHASAIQML